MAKNLKTTQADRKTWFLIKEPGRANKCIRNGQNMNSRMFLEEFRNYLEALDTVSARVFIFGDFNFWFEMSMDRSVTEFNEMMMTLQFRNWVDKVTTSTGHMLDLVFSNMTNGHVCDMFVDDICTVSPVHRLIKFSIPHVKPLNKKKTIVFRDKKNLLPALWKELGMGERKTVSCSVS